MRFTTPQFRIADLIPVSRSVALMFYKFQFCECPVYYSLDLIRALQLVCNPRFDHFLSATYSKMTETGFCS